MRIFVIGILIIITINSCKLTGNYFDKICDDKSGFHFDTTKGSTDYNINLQSEYLTIHQIGIPSDTFFLRIEVGDIRPHAVTIFEYSFYKSTQTFRIYEFPVKGGGEFNEIMFDKTKDKLKDFETVFDPTKKGKEFIAQLEKNHILELPDSDDIPGYTPRNQSPVVIIEYSNRCRHNIVWFSGIGHPLSKKFKQANELANFINYLKKEFGY